MAEIYHEPNCLYINTSYCRPGYDRCKYDGPIFEPKDGFMKRTFGRILIPVLTITLLTLMAPLSVQADGVEGESIQTVNGYQAALAFAEEPGIGENQVHIQIHDAMAMPVTNAAVEVMVMPLEEEGHAE